MRREDGSIQSSNVQPGTGGRDYTIYRCQVTKVVYTDNPLNVTKDAKNPQVLYEAIIVGGKNDGFVFSNCRDATKRFGSGTHYEERILQASPKKMNLQSPDSEEPKNQPGDMVFVALVNGDYNLPIIIGLETSPLDEESTGAEKAEGPRWIYEYNGVLVAYNNQGDLTITRKGGELDEETGVFTPDEEGDTATIALTENVIDITANSGGEDGPTGVKIDGENDAITITMAGGQIVTIDGTGDSFEITTKGGSSIKVSGDPDQILLKTAGGVELNLKEGKVAIGDSTAELLQQISDTLDKIATFMTNVDATHTHLGNLGFPTSPPTPATGFTQLGSDLNAIKAKVDGIKGSIE